MPKVFLDKVTHRRVPQHLVLSLPDLTSIIAVMLGPHAVLAFVLVNKSCYLGTKDTGMQLLSRRSPSSPQQAEWVLKIPKREQCVDDSCLYQRSGCFFNRSLNMPHCEYTRLMQTPYRRGRRRSIVSQAMW